MIDSPKIKIEEENVLFSAKATLKSRDFVPWIYFTTLTSLFPVAIWGYLQFFPLEGTLSGPLFTVSLLLTAICSAPYRSAKRLVNFPISILVTEHIFYLKQGRREWLFEKKDIEKVCHYSMGPIYGLEILYQKRRLRWPFVNANTAKQLQEVFQNRSD